MITPFVTAEVPGGAKEGGLGLDTFAGESKTDKEEAAIDMICDLGRWPSLRKK